MAALTETEQAEILRFLGYTNWESLFVSYRWDYPTLVPTEYIVRDTFSRISDAGLEMVRKDLVQLRAIETQIASARCRLQATKVGDIQTNPEELRTLRGEWEIWKQQLADDLGAQVNPNRNTGGPMPGGRNARVING